MTAQGEQSSLSTKEREALEAAKRLIREAGKSFDPLLVGVLVGAAVISVVLTVILSMEGLQ